MKFLNPEFKAAYEAGAKMVDDAFAPVQNAINEYWKWREIEFAKLMKWRDEQVVLANPSSDDDPKWEELSITILQAMLEYDSKCAAKMAEINKLAGEFNAAIEKNRKIVEKRHRSAKVN